MWIEHKILSYIGWKNLEAYLKYDEGKRIKKDYWTKKLIIHDVFNLITRSLHFFYYIFLVSLIFFYSRWYLVCVYYVLHYITICKKFFIIKILCWPPSSSSWLSKLYSTTYVEKRKLMIDGYTWANLSGIILTSK